MEKSVKIGLAAAITLPILVAVAIPLFVDAKAFRPKIENRLSAALSRKVTLGDLSMSLLRGSLVADDLSIAEDPKFGQEPFFTAKRLHIGVEMRPLIFHHELIVRSFEADAPNIHLIRGEDGGWNYSTLGHGGGARPASSADLPVDEINIRDGHAEIRTLASDKNPQVYDHLDVTFDHFSMAKGFAFMVSASLPGDGKVNVSGTVGPIDAQDAANTTFDTRVSIAHLDPVAAGYVDPAAGISMIGGLNAHIVSDGGTVTSDGKVHAEHLTVMKGGKRDSLAFSDLDVKFDHFSLEKGFPFMVSASLPGDGKVKVLGRVGGIDPKNAANTSFDARVSIEHLDPVAAGYVDPAAGISMIAGFDGHIVSDGATVTSDGKVHAEHLILLKGGRAAPYPVDVSYQVVHSLKKNSGNVSDLAFQTGAVAMHIKGTYRFADNVPVFDLKLLAPSIPIDGLQAILPAVGAKLPDGASLKGGTLSANFNIKGTPKDDVIEGSYELKNTELLHYDLGSKIVGIAALGGIKTGDHVAITESRADVRVTKAGSESTNIYSVLPALGESTGSGRVSPAGQLDFHLISKVTNAKGLNKVGIDLLTKLNSTSAGAKPSTASGIPINITGTAENPVITADIDGLMKGNAATIRGKGTELLDKAHLSRLFKKKTNSVPPPEQKH